jgi:uncharacterized protein GlcG (DUF336 family)
MSPHVRATPTLTAEAAQLMIDAAATKADEIGVPQCIAVVDPAGDLIAFRRMDGAKSMSIATATAKAVTAARTRNNSGPLPDHLGLSVAMATGGVFTELRGGRAIVIGADCVGAIGVGSGTPDQDEAVADAALEAVGANA